MKIFLLLIFSAMLLLSPIGQNDCRGEGWEYKDLEYPWEYHGTENIFRVAVRSERCDWFIYPHENDPYDCIQVGGWADVGGLGTTHVNVKVSCPYEILQVEFYPTLEYYLPLLVGKD